MPSRQAGGESVKDYILECTLGEAPVLDAMGPDEAVTTLGDFLDVRIGQAGQGELSMRSMAEIRDSAQS